MRVSRHYDHDILIAEYTLGLLTPQETAHVHTLMASDSAAAVTALKWESSFLQLVDALEPVTPSAHVLKQVQTALGHSPSPPTGRLLRPAATSAPAPERTPPAPARIIDKPRVEPSIAGEGLAPSDNTSDTTANPAPVSPTLRSDSSAQASPSISVKEAPVVSASSETSAIPTKPMTAPAQSFGTNNRTIDNRSTEKQTVVAAPSISKAKTDAQSGLGALWNSSAIWRAIVVALAIACAALALKPAPPLIQITETAPTHAAILSAPGTSSTPGWVLTIDTANNVLLTPQVSTEIGAQNVVQLWTQNAQDASPRSLGLIDVNRPVIIKAEDIGVVQPSQLFEMTLEAQGGSATGQPTGPVLFIGRVVLFGSPEPTVHDATTTGATS
jgi:anti-sigma-K factor RskA